MKLLKAPSGLHGVVTVPGDKSITHRAVILGSLATGKTRIKNALNSQDTQSTRAIFENFGVKVGQEKNGDWLIESSGVANFNLSTSYFYFGNSGTTIRLMMGVLSGMNLMGTLSGDDSLNKRPMNRIVDPLNAMGADLLAIDGHAPVEMRKHAQLHGIQYRLPIASAQLKSAILLAGLFAEGETIIEEPVPSRNHTELMLQEFGIEITKKKHNIRLKGSQISKLTAQDIVVPGDISSAAFFIAAGILVPDSKIVLENVGINPTRSGLLEVLEKMNAKIALKTKDVGAEVVADLSITTQLLKATEISGEIIPRLIDELPIIALLATQAVGTTLIKDAQELKVKETNRIDAIADSLNVLGAEIEKTEDGLIIHGATPLHGGEVSSLGDHRIGMMLQIASLLTEETVELDGAESIGVSYPEFFNDLKRVGAI